MPLKGEWLVLKHQLCILHESMTASTIGWIPLVFMLRKRWILEINNFVLAGFKKAMLWMWALCYQNSPRYIAAPPGQTTMGYSSESCTLVPAKKSMLCVHGWFGWSKEHLIIHGGIAKHKLCGKSIPIVYPQTFIIAVLFTIWRPARVLLMFLLVCSLDNFHIHFPKVCVQCFMFAAYGLAETT